MILALLRAWVRGHYLKWQCRIIGHIWIRVKVPPVPKADVVALYQDLCIICGCIKDENAKE